MYKSRLSNYDPLAELNCNPHSTELITSSIIFPRLMPLISIVFSLTNYKSCQASSLMLTVSINFMSLNLILQRIPVK